MQFLFVLPFGGQCGGGVGRQLAHELDRPLEAGPDRPLGRLGPECGAFDPDHLDVGHAEERQELQQVGRDVIELPARLVLGLWFLMNLYNTLLSTAATLNHAEQGGGVAFAAHVGGFVAGLLLIRLMATRRQPQVRTYERPRFFDDNWR